MTTRYTPNMRRNDQRMIMRQVLAFIRKFIKENGISPSITEIAEGCFRSRSGIVRYLDILEARGYITRIPNLPRSIRILDDENRRL